VLRPDPPFFFFKSLCGAKEFRIEYRCRRLHLSLLSETRRLTHRDGLPYIIRPRPQIQTKITIVFLFLEKGSQSKAEVYSPKRHPSDWSPPVR